MSESHLRSSLPQVCEMGCRGSQMVSHPIAVRTACLRGIALWYG